MQPSATSPAVRSVVILAICAVFGSCGLIEEQLLPPLNMPPTAAIVKAEEDPDDPLIVIFEASAQDLDGGEIITYHWNFGDGQTGSGKKLPHKYSEKGVYFVTVTVTDDDGTAFTTPPMRVAVRGRNQAPVAKIGASRLEGPIPLEIVFNGGESFDPDPGDKIAQYAWTFGDGKPGKRGDKAEAEIVVHTYESVGTFIVNLTVTDVRGAADTRSVPVRATLPPQ